jgi:hypothetical protein
MTPTHEAEVRLLSVANSRQRVRNLVQDLKLIAVLTVIETIIIWAFVYNIHW